MNKYTLVVIKAKGCGPCMQLEKSWSLYEKEIRSKYPDININMVTFDYSTGQILDPQNAPQELKTMFRGYPSFILISTEHWKKALSGSSQGNNYLKEVSYIFGCKYVKSGTSYIITTNEKYGPHTKENILKWIDVEKGLSVDNVVSYSSPLIKPMYTAKPITNYTNPSTNDNTSNSNAKKSQTEVKVYKISSGNKVICGNFKLVSRKVR
jgi:thioredoxin-related protein